MGKYDRSSAYFQCCQHCTHCYMSQVHQHSQSVHLLNHTLQQYVTLTNWFWKMKLKNNPCITDASYVQVTWYL
jgi:hypothetical protein